MKKNLLNARGVSNSIISKQDFLKRIDENLSQEEKSIWQKRIEQNSKKIYSLLYILGSILVFFMMGLPERKVENNADRLLLIGDYFSIIIPTLIIPLIFIFLGSILFMVFFTKKMKPNIKLIVYSALGINKIEKDEKQIRKLRGIGFFPGYRYRIHDSFEIQNGKGFGIKYVLKN